MSKRTHHSTIREHRLLPFVRSDADAATPAPEERDDEKSKVESRADGVPDAITDATRDRLAGGILLTDEPAEEGAAGDDDAGELDLRFDEEDDADDLFDPAQLDRDIAAARERQQEGSPLTLMTPDEVYEQWRQANESDEG